MAQHWGMLIAAAKARLRDMTVPGSERIDRVCGRRGSRKSGTKGWRALDRASACPSDQAPNSAQFLAPLPGTLRRLSASQYGVYRESCPAGGREADNGRERPAWPGSRASDQTSWASSEARTGNEGKEQQSCCTRPTPRVDVATPAAGDCGQRGSTEAAASLPRVRDTWSKSFPHL